MCLEEAVYKQYNQYWSLGILIQSEEVKSVSTRPVGIPNLSASEGWVQQFKNNHGINQQCVYGEMLDTIQSSIRKFLSVVAYTHFR